MLRMRIELRARAGDAIRCPYCHDTLGTEVASPCSFCGTRLHAGCWSEVGPCPTLGCFPRRPRLKIVLGPARARGARLGGLLSGAFGATLWMGTARVIPAFARMFEETGISLPASSELLLSVPGWAWWLLAALSLVVMTLKDRRVEPAPARALDWLHAVLIVGAGCAIVVALFLPLTCIYERL